MKWNEITKYIQFTHCILTISTNPINKPARHSPYAMGILSASHTRGGKEEKKIELNLNYKFIAGTLHAMDPLKN